MKRKIGLFVFTVAFVALLLFFNIEQKEGRIGDNDVTAVRIFNCLVINKGGDFQKVESVREFDFSKKEKGLVYITCDGEKCRLYR